VPSTKTPPRAGHTASGAALDGRAGRPERAALCSVGWVRDVKDISVFAPLTVQERMLVSG